LNILPCGAKTDSGIKNLLGNGVIISPDKLLEDIETVEDEGLILDGRLHISDRAIVETALHKQIASRLKKARES